MNILAPPFTAVLRRGRHCVVSLLFTLLCAETPATFGQMGDMQAVSYNLSNVLPADLIKGTIQDGRGFVWAASDAGVMRFDGRRSTLYKNLPSQYVKGFIAMPSGDIFVLTDMGLARIEERGDSVLFPVVVRGAVTRSDSTLFYPKTIFLASNGDVWISEPDAVVRLRKSAMKRFPFAARYAADSFTRAFSFVEELDGGLIVVSQRGQGLFRFNVAREAFEEIPVKNAQFNAVSAIMLKDKIARTLWIATDKGVMETSLSADDARRAWKLALPVQDASCFVEDNVGNVYIGTWYMGLRYFQNLLPSGKLLSLSSIDSKTINHVRVTDNGNVWVSADDGITLLHPYAFIKPTLPFQRPFIQHAIASRSGGEILASDGATVVRVKTKIQGFPAEFGSKEALTLRNQDMGSVSSVAEHPDGSVWCSSSGGYLLRAPKNGATSVVRKVSSENFYFYIAADAKGRVWACRNPDGRLSAFLPDGSERVYDSARGVSSGIFVARESASGTVFAAGGGANAYLFRYNNAEDRFHNISAPLPFAQLDERFIVNDVGVESDTSLWLATNYGMVRFHNGVADTIPFSGEVARRNAVAVAIAPRGSGVVFATDHGVYLYTHGQLVAVDLRLEKMVLSPGYRSAVIDKRSQLWLGTKLGLLVSAQFANLAPQTQMPTIVSLRANGARIGVAEGEHASGLYLQAAFTALCYPAEKVRYQTRLVSLDRKGGFANADTVWNEARYTAEEIFPSISAGEYLLQIRAQQEGYLWSEPAQYRFSVRPAWYARWWAWCLYGLCVVGLMYGAAKFWARRLELRNRALKRMVDERTEEIQRQLRILDEQAGEIEIANTRLQEQNLQLVQFNNEKNEFLGIVAHDLKNPLTGIMMTSSMARSYFDRLSRDEILAQFQRIEETSQRMQSIITELLDVNAIETGNINVNILNVNIVRAVAEVMDDFRARAESKNIALHLRSERDSIEALADPNLLRQILENIVSNAVKYSPTGKNVFVSVVVNERRRARVAVRDEGPGLSPQDKDKLFRKFAKLSARPTAGEDSTGLGLSIVKRMVEAMHGSVWCESELGQGAAFIVEFPLAPTGERSA
jgi:signal transduction histidine kinase/ligand-binding sensor domain-containing protein